MGDSHCKSLESFDSFLTLQHFKIKFSPVVFQSKGLLRGSMSVAGGYKQGTAGEAGTPAADKLETSTVMEWSKPQSLQPHNRS